MMKDSLPSLVVKIPKLSRRTKPVKASTFDPSKSFTFFQTLPPELQLHIWQIAVKQIEPRVVEINSSTHSLFPKHGYNEDDSDESEDEDQDVSEPPEKSSPSFYSPSAVPAILSASRNARAAALSEYKLSFGTPSSEARIYFNFRKDTLYFPEYIFDTGSVASICPFERSISILERAQVRRIGIDILRWFGIGESHAHGKTWAVNGQIDLGKWEGLQELVWVGMKSLGNGRCSSCEDRVKPSVLGVVNFEDYEVPEGETFGYGFGVKETLKYINIIRKILPREWVPPSVKYMALTRNGVRVKPTIAGLDEDLELVSDSESSKSE